MATKKRPLTNDAVRDKVVSFKVNSSELRLFERACKHARRSKRAQLVELLIEYAEKNLR